MVSENALIQLRIDPRGMPWTPKSLRNIIGRELLAPNGGDITSYSFEGKKVALYFSASWCKPCQIFLPTLISAARRLSSSVVYAINSEDGNKKNETTNSSAILSPPDVFSDLEVIFVSLDRDQDSFDQYRSMMPWPALPFKDIRRAELQSGLRIRAIPALLIFDEQDKLLTATGVTDLLTDTNLTTFPWSMRVLDLGARSSIERLERGPAIVALTENCSIDIKLEVRSLMNKCAEAACIPVRLPRSPREELTFSTLEASGRLSEAFRSLFSLPPASTDGSLVFVVLDLEQSLYYVEVLSRSTIEADKSIIAEKLEQLISSFKSYELKLKQLDNNSSVPDYADTAGETPSVTDY